MVVPRTTSFYNSSPSLSSTKNLIIMRRSKSDPSKYARNYRKISQRRMTQFDGVDEEKEMERLRSILLHSERQLKQLEDPDAVVSTSRADKKRKRSNDRLKEIVDPSIDDPSATSRAILSEELTAELFGGDFDGGENPLIVLPSKKGKRNRDKKVAVHLSPEEIREAKSLKLKTSKKIQQLETRAIQKKKRAELYKRLEASQVVPQSQLQPLLKSSGNLSRKQSATKKQTLKRILTKERAGLSLTEEEKELLYPEYEVDESNVEKSKNLTESQEVDRAEKADIRGKMGTHKVSESSTKDQVVLHEQVNKKMMTPMGSSVGSDFASLMMASLSDLKKESAGNSESTHENSINDLSVQVEPSRRYVPVNPTIVQTAATMGLQPASSSECPNRRVLHVKRPPEVEVSRFDLPVTAMEFEITDAICDNDVTIICGETGSGKSTQIPSILYEAGMTTCPYDAEKNFLIGVTQPRRVAAVSTAKRVCYEMGQGNGQSILGSSKKGNLVAYQTRYETAGVGDTTRIKFMTDGILLNEIQSDLLLRRYSVVVLDECHERNLNTDVLIGLLSVALPLRRKAAFEDPSIVPLKLILMSATLRIEDFTKNKMLFPTCPPAVVLVPGRTFPVTIHHSKVTELDDYGKSIGIVIFNGLNTSLNMKSTFPLVCRNCGFQKSVQDA
jgi:ATP-dependent RNA helicase DHX37/DHR1